MATGITEIFTNGSTCKRSIILQRSRVTCRSSNNNRIIHCAILTQGIHDSSYSRTFLAYSYINTIYRISCLIIGTLINNCVNSNSRLSRLTVTDDQLTLSATDRYHGIHSFQSGLQRLIYRLTKDNTRRFTFQRHLT